MEIYNLIDKLKYIKEVAELEYNEWADKPDENRILRIERKINKILDNLKKENFCKLILVDGENLVGFISIFPHDCDELPELIPWYATMYVKKEYRGRHCSKILNDAILGESRKRGYKKIYLKTELQNYYEKFGAKFVKKINSKESLYEFIL